MQRRLARVDLREHEDKILLLLALVISAVVGLIVVAFVAVTERMGRVLLTAGGMQRVLSPLVGSLVGGWLLFKYFPDARGSGIPQTRVALILQNGVIGVRTVIGKFICSSISLGSGVALGREGPSVHIGAGIASAAGRRLGLSEEQVQSLIPVGTAAAVAAAFNTPLAAVLFTLEEILADLHARVVGSVVIGACTSWIVLRLILGDEPLFHVPAYQLVHPLEFFIYALLGLLGGLVSTAFVKLLLWQRAAFPQGAVAMEAVHSGRGRSGGGIAGSGGAWSARSWLQPRERRAERPDGAEDDAAAPGVEACGYKPPAMVPATPAASSAPPCSSARCLGAPWDRSPTPCCPTTPATPAHTLW